MISFLQKYLKINTAYPNPDYHAVVALFKQQAMADGFLFKEIILPSGNPVLIITLQGCAPQLRALALNHHMDVVPAENVDEWIFPPFAGKMHGNILYGRGAQDCKGLGAVHYAALSKLKQSGVELARTIHLIMVPDEERGGFLGTKELIEHPLFNSLNIGYVLDEGMPSGSDTELLLKVDERTPIQICVTSSGSQSHASGLLHQNCVHELIKLLAEVIEFHTEQQKLIAADQAGNLISMHVTSLTTNNNALNVIPSQAQATIDIRIPSRLSLDDGIALIDRLVQGYPGISYEVLATSRERFKGSVFDSDLYNMLAQSVADYGLTPQPFAFEATTDARFYSHKGIEAIGFTPFSVPANLHGTNESIRIKDIEQGVVILDIFLRAFCTLNN